jgi:hypothetical protein
MTAENVVAIIGLLGLGGLVSGYFTLMWQRRHAELSKYQEYKETRYKCIILLMHGVLDFKRSKAELQKYGQPVNTVDDLSALLRAEHVNAFLYASDEFLGTLEDFLGDANWRNLYRTALAIRRDLWRVQSQLTLEDVRRFAKPPTIS